MNRSFIIEFSRNKILPRLFNYGCKHTCTFRAPYRLKPLILWQAALITSPTHAKICSRHPAPQRHENNQKSMESHGSSQTKCSTQRYNQYCFDWIAYFNRQLDKPKLGFECFSFTLLHRGDCCVTTGFHTDSVCCKKSVVVAKGERQTLWHLKRGCRKVRREPIVNNRSI